jgi:hypothetical protein
MHCYHINHSLNKTIVLFEFYKITKSSTQNTKRLWNVRLPPCLYFASALRKSKVPTPLMQSFINMIRAYYISVFITLLGHFWRRNQRNAGIDHLTHAE